MLRRNKASFEPIEVQVVIQQTIQSMLEEAGRLKDEMLQLHQAIQISLRQLQQERRRLGGEIQKLERLRKRART